MLHLVLHSFQQSMYVLGQNHCGVLAINGTFSITSFTQTPLPRLFDKFITTQYHNFYLDKGKIWASGNSKNGEFGYATDLPIVSPIKQLENYTIIGAAAGNNHTIYLTSQNEIFTAGDNSYQQLGRQTVDKLFNTPKKANISFNDQNTKIKLIAATQFTSYYVTTTNKVFVTGYCIYGLCGEDLKGESHLYQQIDWTEMKLNPNITGIKELSGSNNNLILKDSNNKIFILGSNQNSQTCNNINSSIIFQFTEISVHSGEYYTKIVTTERGSLLLSNDNQLLFCGVNYHSKYLNLVSTPTYIELPLQNKPIQGFAMVQEGWLIMQDNKLYGRGRNQQNLLGIKSKEIYNKWEYVNHTFEEFQQIISSSYQTYVFSATTINEYPQKPQDPQNPTVLLIFVLSLSGLLLVISIALITSCVCYYKKKNAVIIYPYPTLVHRLSVNEEFAEEVTEVTTEQTKKKKIIIKNQLQQQTDPLVQ